MGLGVAAASASRTSFFGLVACFLGFAGRPVVIRIFSGSWFLIVRGLPGLRFTGSSGIGAVEVGDELLVVVELTAVVLLFLELG